MRWFSRPIGRRGLKPTAPCAEGRRAACSIRSPAVSPLAGFGGGAVGFSPRRPTHLENQRFGGRCPGPRGPRDRPENPSLGRSPGPGALIPESAGRTGPRALFSGARFDRVFGNGELEKIRPLRFLIASACLDGSWRNKRQLAPHRLARTAKPNVEATVRRRVAEAIRRAHVGGGRVDPRPAAKHAICPRGRPGRINRSRRRITRIEVGAAPDSALETIVIAGSSCGSS